MVRSLGVFACRYDFSLCFSKRFVYISAFICLLYVILVVHFNFILRKPMTKLLMYDGCCGGNVKKAESSERIEPGHSSVSGSFNVHVWTFPCSSSIEKLVEYPLFPIAPHVQTLADTLDVQLKNLKNIVLDNKDFGERVFGFVRMPVSGNYRFALSCNGSAELWLSKDGNWENVQLMCKTGARSETPWNRKYDFRSNSHQISAEIFLESNRFCFMEILHVQSGGNPSLQVEWNPPYSRNFEIINKTFMYSFTQEHLSFKEFIQSIPVTKSVQSYDTKHQNNSILENKKFLETDAKYLHSDEVNLTLPLCSYNPGYVGKSVTYQYETVEKFVNPSYVYPEVKHPKITDGKWIPWFPLDEKDATSVTEDYMKHLELVYPGKYHMTKILNLEKKPNWSKENPVFYEGRTKHGDRYLIELELWDQIKNKSFILSEYIYKHSGSGKLCYPTGMNWNRTVPVYLLISVRKQGEWVWHFIKNMEQLYLDTKDENLHLVLYDYNSTDIDIEEELQKGSFKNYKVLKMAEGKYSRTYSLNRAAEAVSDPHAIIFTLDLHLEIPLSFPNNVRKHCVEGKMVYTPIICRLACGASPQDPAGSWDPWGYGMFGAYKSDWDRFKGFDEEKYKTRWGGEDWDVIDRAYKVGLEFERIKHADFYHYHHSRKGMW